MKANDIRRTFLGFYRERAHKIFPPFSLVPDDPTLLFTVAGMVPFKPYLSGERPIEFPRAASCQPVIRTNDIENVGITARHCTMFEMLGNFSFGDYFKEDAIKWAWELSTTVFGLDGGRIWVTVFEEDDESVRIWHDVIGLPEDRIIRRDKEDNLWWMGVAGPGGPCSELFYDRRPEEERGAFEDGDGLMEFYNLVFTEFEIDDHHNVVKPLPKKNVDTGMGFERIAQILQDVPNLYETDVMRPIVARAEQLSGVTYGTAPKSDFSLRVMAEHARAATFLIGDGVMPANEDRGYVLRALIRRAVRHAKLLGLDDLVMPGLVDAVVETMGDGYPQLGSSRAFITQVVKSEEEGFRETLQRGLGLLDTEIKKKQPLSGDIAFKLHDTYGFPFELTLEIANEAGLDVDRAGFEALMNEQRERARGSRAFGPGADESALQDVLKEHGASQFIGYDRESEEAKLVGLVKGGALVTSAGEGDEIEVVLDQTPFYPEGGGQIGDAGIIEVNGAIIEVTDTQRRVGDLIVHTARVTRGELTTGSAAFARVDAQRRASTQRSHTATHILHATLRAALGDHARQAGSLVEPGRLRFDFSHFDRVPRELLDEVEHTVNTHLLTDDGVRAYETTMDEARNRGAMMLFEEKYGDIVRVVEIGDYSVELCGGIHVARTSQIGAVKVLGEASIGSNLRRIEALTGFEAIESFRHSRALLEHMANQLKATPETAPEKLSKLLDDLRKAELELRKLKQAGERGAASELTKDAETIGNTKVLIGEAPGADANVGALQQLALAARESLGAPALVVLFGRFATKAAVVAVTDKQNSIDPKNVIAKAAELIGGRVGGKGPLATAVGDNQAQLAGALEAARAAARELLG